MDVIFYKKCTPMSKDSTNPHSFIAFVTHLLLITDFIDGLLQFFDGFVSVDSLTDIR